MPDNVPNGWNQWSKYVLKELERLADGQEKIEKQLNGLTVEFKQFQTAMKIKSGVWGAMAGAVPAIVVLTVLLIKNLL